MRVSFVVEDLAHAQLVPPLFRRIAREAGVEIDPRRPVVPMGGVGPTLRGLRQLLADIRVGVVPLPDLIVIGLDADCGPQGNRSQQVERACALEQYQGAFLTAEPDPHVEIWYFADPECVQTLLQIPDLPTVPTVRCRKDEYKDRLRSVVRSGGSPAPLGGVEYGPAIAKHMDLYRAGRNVASLGRFVNSARSICAGQSAAPR